MKTNDFFIKGKLNILLDVSAGSSGKGKAASYLCDHADNYQFVCNAFMPQASHVVIDDTGTYVYKQFNSIAHKHEKFEKMYIGQGAVIDLKVLLEEIEFTKIPDHKLGISPIATILQPMDKNFEQGTHDFDGNKLKVQNSGTIKFGSTCSGVGAARARKVIRRPNILLARDVPELSKYICDVPAEILDRLSRGQSGLLEVAQGVQLSNGLPEMFPYCTSRNVTVAAALDDMMLPVTVVGNILLNLRTYPIRIHKYKYISKSDGRHLTWAEVQSGSIPYDKIDSDSGPGWPDQEEMSWEELTEKCGSDVPIMECTTLTKLPRRVFTFSKIGLKKAIDICQTPFQIHLYLNFANYVDFSLTDKRNEDVIDLSNKMTNFIEDEILSVSSQYNNVRLKYLGTGAHSDSVLHFEV